MLDFIIFDLFGLAARAGRSINAPVEERERFDEVARMLGLEPKDGAASRDDGGVIVTARHVRRDGEPWSVVTASLQPALDLGLIVTSRSLDPRGRSVRIGDPRFDDPGGSYRVSTDEARRAEKLLGPKLRDAIVAVPLGYNLRITDSSVRFEERGRASKLFFERAMRSAADLVRRLRKNAERTPTAKGLAEHARSYRALAEERALQLCKTPLGIVGRVDGCEVGIVSVRRGRDAFGAQAVARLELHCTDEDVARRRLDAPVKGRVDELSKLGELSLTKEALSLRLSDFPAATQASRLFDHVSGLAERLRAASTEPSPTPYR